MGRIIGIVHRTKRTKEGEARPTIIAVSFPGEKVKIHKLEDDQAEMDFVLGLLPVAWEEYIPEVHDLSHFQEKHLKRDKVGNVTKVPLTYDGLTTNDTVVMALGGSGDRLAFSAYRRLAEIGGSVMRVAPFRLKELRGEGKKDNDHVLLADAFSVYPEMFREMADRDADLIKVREAFFARQEAMKARIGCEQRLRQSFIGRVFLTESGGFPEGSIEAAYDAEKANNAILTALLKEESSREAELKKAVRCLHVWEEVFKPLPGVGEMIAARLITSIGDIRRFKTDAQFKKFCGVHVLPDGTFVRRRSGEVANWNPEARQALYLLGDQFNRRPDTEWGQKLREYKVKLREKHPEPVAVKSNGGKAVTRYTDGHIHKMAVWRTVTKFAEWLHREWSRLENSGRQ